MAISSATSKCPYCLEEIKPGAVICKHCRTPLKKPEGKKSSGFWQTKFMWGFYSGVAVMIVLIILFNRIF